jgi:predicted ester cyclase
VSSNVTSGTEGAPGAAEGAAEQSRRLLEEGFNEGKFDLIDQWVAPDAVNHDPGLPASLSALRGPDLLRRTVEMYRAAFPDVRMVVDEAIDGGDKVALRWHAEGTQQGELQGLSPTGARVSVTGISIDHWRDGKIAESWTEWDNLGLARQLGAAPPEGSVVEKVGLVIHRLTASWMRKKNQ